MDATAFVRKWAASKRTERAASQEHFIDLCNLLGEQTPNTDPTGDYYAFEKGARTRDGDGFADVWLKGRFSWEYKGKRKDLVAAYGQLQKYREALENTPLLVVCDLDRFEVHTNFTGTETWIYYFRNADIETDSVIDVRTIAGTQAKDAPELTALGVLTALFAEPERLRPQKTREEITKDAAKMFGDISDELRKWDVEDMRIARFITKTMFCMFATDVGLLPPGTFSEVIRLHRESGDAKSFRTYLSRLFKVMDKGGKFAMHDIPRFNGLLFRDSDVPEQIGAQEIHALERLDALNWSDVEPAVFGTLFEGVLERDKVKRKAIGAHYTSREDVELIVEPVLMEPLHESWRAITAQIDEYAQKRVSMDGKKERARKLILPFHRRLTTIRVLDPACGSGNFLYVSLALLKALEKRVIAYAAAFDITITPKVHPRQLFGIEINDYAHELASIVIWIGYLQWKKQNQPAAAPDIPVLQPLDQIELKDAIVATTKAGRPREAAWPEADVIVGNPPFLGGKMLRKGLGDEYVERMFAVYDGRVERQSDLCCYWFEKARDAIETGNVTRAGLLATQAIRTGASRRVLERIKESGDIFYAQSDRPWVLKGASVRVSMVGFDDGSETRRRLNEETEGEARNALLRARPVPVINANLTSQVDVTQAQRLKENLGISFQGDTKVGPFEIEEGAARKMLGAPNPHGKPNSDVVRPWINALDVTRRPRKMWIIDFPPGTTERDAALFEAPFEYIKENVRPFRITARSGDATGVPWWIHQRPRPDMRAALAPLQRYLVTPRVATYRTFMWVPHETLADARLFVFARSDDYFFGVLQSRVHQAWALATSSRHGVGNDPTYNNTTCFETFPMPHGTKEHLVAVAAAARRLSELRQSWLNPKEDVGRRELSQRTLTNLYNKRPTWLVDAHRALDEAVFAAYGWREAPDDLADAEIVARLLALNLSREPV